MTILTKNELINMLWGLSSHDKEVEKWNLDFVSNGGLVCLKEEQKKVAAIGMLLNEIARYLAKHNPLRSLDIASALIENSLPTQLKNTECEELINRARELLATVSNPDCT
ncbi:hypothetical protein ACUR5C_00290 [Aliikangiella sp. IMCC44653]